MQRVFWTFAVIYFTSQSAIGVELRTFSKTFTLPDGKGQKWFYFYHTHYFLSRACEQNEKKTERTCVLKLEKNFFNDTSDPLGTCKITLKAGDDTQFDYLYHFNIYDQDKVLGVWYERNKNYKTERTYPEGYGKFVIIHFPSCNTTEIGVPFSHEEYNWYKYEFLLQPAVLRKDGFEIVYRNSTICDDKYCKISYDSKGNKISGPDPWYSPIHNPTYNREHVTLPDDKGVVTSEVYRTHIHYYIVRPDGTKIMLKDIEGNSGLHKTPSKSLTGILVCNLEIDNTTLTCAQFDFDGKPMMEVSLHLGFSNRHSKFMTLPNGGFILTTPNCWLPPNCDNDYKPGQHVVKINEFGKRVGSIKIPEQNFGANCSIKADGLYKVGIEEYCSLWLYRCDGESFDKEIHAFAKCFNDADFS
ncbi:uncharacterized protein LOC131671443 [Phymastichus coffea]|uniref:uncharacterized protein LOC131671443 n=1 Tax=Phymastichus coffea TaxID=108790 RepID=UPI00273AB997|nr:uncharacterized protein LOC131671443 [Phymastichus coffea]